LRFSVLIWILRSELHQPVSGSPKHRDANEISASATTSLRAIAIHGRFKRHPWLLPRGFGIIQYLMGGEQRSRVKPQISRIHSKLQTELASLGPTPTNTSSNQFRKFINSNGRYGIRSREELCPSGNLRAVSVLHKIKFVLDSGLRLAFR
jgi:hypothetical protein